MAYDIGAKLGIDGEAQFRSAMKAVSSQVKALGAEMTMVTSSFAGNEKSMEALTAKNEVLGRQMSATKTQISTLNSEYERQKSKLDGLGEALEKAKAEFGENSKEAGKAQNAYNNQAKTCNELQSQINNATASLNKMSNEAAENERAMKEAGSGLAEFADKLKNGVATAAKAAGSGLATVADKLKNGITAAAKAAATGVAAATTAVAGLVKSSLEGFADQEQLIGGVETLFGAGGKSIEEYAASVGKSVDDVRADYASMMEAQELVLANANDAYKTAGLSANEYMETVTSFAASLVSSLDGQTDIAASVANTAIEDMADNANKMGSSMESIQNAYQGFAKQNYTMLDNLKLGYGGTKEEMERLLADAEKLTGQKYDISSFADIIDAIHAVQTEMGITGTTAKEASQTISGSIASMKSAWQNTVTGIADENANMEQLVGNVVESVVTVGNNVIPRIQQILSGIGTAVQQVAPVISEQIPSLVESILPPLLSAGTTLLTGLVEGFVSAAPALVDAALEVVMMLTSYLTDEANLRTLVDASTQIIVMLATGIGDALPELIPAIVQAIVFIGKNIIEHIPELLDAARQIVVGIAQGIMNAFPELRVVWTALKQGFSDAWTGIKQTFSSVKTFFTEKFTEAKTGAVNAWNDIKSRFTKIWSDIKSAFNFKDALNWGRDLIQNFIDGITAKWNALKDKVKNVAQTVKNFLGFSEPAEGPLSNFHTYAPDMMKLYAQGIADSAGVVQKQLDKALSFDFSAANIDFAGGFGDVQRSLSRSMDELMSNASAGSVPNLDTSSPRRPEGTGGIDPETLAKAIAIALNGVGIYLSERKVGQIITNYQANDVRARGANPVPV